MIQSAYTCEGHFDLHNLNKAELKQLDGEHDKLIKNRLYGAHFEAYESDFEDNHGTSRYEFAFTPNFGFLGSPEPLLNNCQLKISFDRSHWSTALTEYRSVVNSLGPNLTIQDCYAITEYVSSPRIRNYFETIDTSPILYKYDECDVIIKSLPKNETEIRFDSLRGGNVPTYLFAGIIPQKNLNGNKEESSTRFEHHGVEEFDIMLNGNSINGYPIHVKNNSAVYPLHKFLDTTNRLHNNECGSSMNLLTFHSNYIWAHHFEVDTDNYGWVGLSLKLKTAFTEAMSLVVWLISDTTLSIDKFHQIEIIN